VSNSLPIFLDYNSTTPCAPEVIEAMLPYFGKVFGSAASKSHVYGGLAEEAVESSRTTLASLIGAKPGEIIFTSGATEAINLAIQGIVDPGKKSHILSFSTEHKAVLDTLNFIQSENVEVTLLPVDKKGLPDLNLLKDSVRSNTILICMMYANNEIGTIMPVKEVGSMCREKGIHFFCDATQAIGKISVDVNVDGMTMLALSGHKLYGPKGIGALYIRSGMKKPRPLIHGGGHEFGLRSGSLNVPGIVGLGKAAEMAKNSMLAETARHLELKKIFLDHILAIQSTQLNGAFESTLPNTANICFDFNEGEKIISRIALKLAVSQGSACSSAITRPSHVLKAMGCSDLQAYRSIRFSLGRPTTLTEINQAAVLIKEAVQTLKI